MSTDVESAPRNGDLDDLDTPPDLNEDNASENDADLFGDDDDEADQDTKYETSPPPGTGADLSSLHRKLDDSELDSADDEGRIDRLADTVEDGAELYEEQKQLKLLDVDMSRVQPPEGDEVLYERETFASCAF